MNALIIGAGVCGPIAALALRRAGIETVVYEAYPQTTAEVGSYLTVATNGLDALRAIGADGSLVEAGFPTNRIVLFSGTGKRLGTVPIGSSRDERDASRTIKRSHLHRALQGEAARRGVRMEFGKRLVAADIMRRGVRARFEDGSEAVGDLLIGCDGVHSRTRTLIDSGAPAPRYVGLLNFGGYTPGSPAGETNAWHMIFGERAFFGYVPHVDGGTVWFANVPRHASSHAERESTTSQQWKQWLMNLFAGDRGPATELIAAGHLELIADNTHDLPFVPVWHKAPLIIIGDAAHAPSPSSGQGASMALEDSVILAQCLRDVPDIHDAFTAFERIRRRRVERIVAQGARSSSTKAAGPVGRVLRDLVSPLVFRYLVTEKSLAWIHEHHIDWESTIECDDGIAAA